jgi:hypothetical protein
MASSPYLTDRVMGMWGPRAYGWTGEAPPRDLGLPYDQSGHQPVPGFPPDPQPPPSHHWLRALAHRHSRRASRSPQPGAS